jgi:hypothetical protein
MHFAQSAILLLRAVLVCFESFVVKPSALMLGYGALLLGLTNLALANAAHAQERIKLYQVELEVTQDGTLHVVEHITINAQGNYFKRGFIRDFPTRYRDTLGNLVRVSFDVISVERDAKPEPYATETIKNGVGVRIGDADVFLPRGDHQYRLEFETQGQIGFFKEHDELYFNVTGPAWEVPIDRAEVSLVLPAEARITDTAVFTGPERSTASNAQSSRGGNVFRASTTRRLEPGDAFTLVVGWPKGFVTPPSMGDQAERFIGDNVAVGIGIVGLLLIIGYYLYMWNLYGRDPEGGTVIPLFSPPKNFSPAAVRFVRRMAYDRKSFAAAILSMAVKRYLDIEEDDGVFTLKKVENASDTALTSGEKQIANKLFAGRSSIVLKDSNHSAVSGAISALGESLKREFEKVYFITNQGYFWIGLIASIIIGALMIFSADLDEDAFASAMAMTVVSACAGFTLHLAFDGWLTVLVGAGNILLNTIFALGKTLIALIPIGIGAVIVASASADIPWIFVLVFVALGGLNFAFYHLLKAPTALGAKTRSEIDGFRMYLGTAEKERLAILHPPEMTPALFERLLPFALALDVEHQWSEQFAHAAAAAGDEAMKSYQPVWYHGTGWDRFGHGNFASNLASSLATATAAAASPPGRSSGFGGGGFSGGGGGGGGGRGW